ncbi:unnamed protein product, partial [Mesorhabditis spiculigera]
STTPHPVPMRVQPKIRGQVEEVPELTDDFEDISFGGKIIDGGLTDEFPSDFSNREVQNFFDEEPRKETPEVKLEPDKLPQPSQPMFITREQLLENPPQELLATVPPTRPPPPPPPPPTLRPQPPLFIPEPEAEQLDFDSTELLEGAEEHPLVSMFPATLDREARALQRQFWRPKPLEHRPPSPPMQPEEEIDLMEEAHNEIESPARTRPLNSANPTFANNKVDSRSLQPSAPQPPIAPSGYGSAEEIQPYSPQHRAQGWNKPVTPPNRPTHQQGPQQPSLPDVFPQQRGQKPQGPAPISDDTVKALDWMLNNITKAAEAGDKQFLKTFQPESSNPPGYSPTFEPYQPAEPLPPGTRRVSYGISKKKPGISKKVGAPSNAHRRQHGWAPQHDGEMKPKIGRKKLQKRPPGLSRRKKPWRGLSKAHYPKVEGGDGATIQAATQQSEHKNTGGYDGRRALAARQLPVQKSPAGQALIDEIDELQALMGSIEKELKLVGAKKEKARVAMEEFKKDDLENPSLNGDRFMGEKVLRHTNAMDLELAPRRGFEVQRGASIGIIEQHQNEPLIFSDGPVAEIGSAGTWKPWSVWGKCFCGNQVRTRACDYVEGVTTIGCEGPSYQSRPCKGGVCPARDPHPRQTIKLRPSIPEEEPEYEVPSRTDRAYFRQRALAPAGFVAL